MEVSLLKVLKLVTKIYIILEFWEIPLTKEKIKLSIITPTYNNGALLQRLYNSIKSQKLKELIWIIVDDGSSDNTRSIVDKFYDKRIIYKKQKNKGPNSARNFGEKFIPRGCKYVIFIDSDDTFYDHNSLEMMYEEIKNSSKKIGAVGFTCISSSTNKNVCFLDKSPLVINYEDSIKGSLFSGEFLSIQKVDILKIQNWPENLFGFEALRHWEINKHFDFMLINKPARIYYRDRKTNLTSPESTIRRAKNMALGIEKIIQNHGEIIFKIAKEKYGYMLLTQSIYYALCGLTIESFKTNFKALKIISKNKNRFISILIFFYLMLPLMVRKKLYLSVLRMNYNYITLTNN